MRSPNPSRRQAKSERSGFFAGLRRRRKGGYNNVGKMKAVERDKMQRRRQPTVYRYSSQDHDTGTSSESRPSSCRGDSVKSKSSSFKDKLVPANVAVVVSEPETAPNAGAETALLRPDSQDDTVLNKQQKELAAVKGVTTLQDVYRESALRDGIYNSKRGDSAAGENGQGCLDRLLENEEPDEFGPYKSNTDVSNGNVNTMLDIAEETCLSEDAGSTVLPPPSQPTVSKDQDSSLCPQRDQSGVNLSRRRLSHDPRLQKPSDPDAKARSRTLSVDETHRSTPMLAASTDNTTDCRAAVSAENLYPNLSHFLPVYSIDHRKESPRGHAKDSRVESSMRHAVSDQSIQQRHVPEPMPRTSESFCHRKQLQDASSKPSPPVLLPIKLRGVSKPKGGALSPGEYSSRRKSKTTEGGKSKVWNEDSLAGLVHSRSVPLRALSSIKSSDV